MGRSTGTAPAWVGWPVVPVGLNLKMLSPVSTTVRRRWRALNAWNISGPCRSVCSVTLSSTLKKMRRRHKISHQKQIRPQMTLKCQVHHLRLNKTLIPHNPTQRAQRRANDEPCWQREPQGSRSTEITLRHLFCLPITMSTWFLNWLSVVIFIF